MTVSSTTNRKTFAGNGVTTSFATSPVVFFDTSDLVLTVVTDSTGASETLMENTDYTVTGGAGTTGTVSLAGGSSPYGAPAAGTTLVIRRVLPLTQDDDFLNNDINDAEVLEDALDRLVMVAQQLDEGNELGVRLSSDETATDALTVLPFDRANKYLGFDASKELVALAAPTDTALTTAYSETLLAAADAPAAQTVLGVTPIPSGLIAMWSGTVATIPTGWYLCDGSNGTPDLTDKFIIGADQDNAGTAKTNITGSLTQTGGSKDAINVSHSHTASVTDPGHVHTGGIVAGATYAGGGGIQSGNTGSSLTGISVSISTEGSSGTNANLPPYYALAFIMKS